MSRNLECPLCLEPFTHACETSCGHAFCAPCILDLWKSNNKTAKIKCPTDRREVSMMIPSYTIRSEVDYYRTNNGGLAGGQGVYLTEREYDAQIEEYNNVNAMTGRNMGVQLQEDWVLVKRIIADKNIIYKIGLFLTILIGIGYFLYPADIIPDEIGWIGYLDDVFVMIACLWGLILFVEWYRKQLIRRIHISAA